MDRKWLVLTPIFLFLTACGCCTNRSIEYRQVSYTPAVVVTAPVTYYNYDPVTPVSEVPIDITTTNADFY